MSFTAKDVQALRQATGAGMMDAKRALEANDGDAEAAKQWLREKGLATPAKRDERENSPGRRRRCSSTATSAPSSSSSARPTSSPRSERFKKLADDLAALVAPTATRPTAERAKELEDLRITLKENIELGDVVRIEAGRRRRARVVPPHPGRPRRQRRAGAAGRRHARSWPTTSPSTSPSPGPSTSASDDVPADDGREGAGDARGHHPQRGQARAGPPQDRRGSPAAASSRRSPSSSSPTPRTTS